MNLHQYIIPVSVAKLATSSIPPKTFYMMFGEEYVYCQTGGLVIIHNAETGWLLPQEIGMLAWSAIIADGVLKNTEEAVA